MALLDDIKLYLRISHNLLDNEIQTVITSAREELKRAGVKAAVAESQEPASKDLVEQAIKTYAKTYYAEPKEAEMFAESFKYQLDNLRKTYPEPEEVS
jgi:uncharacterized phage protein (predicted DNA packaging)